MNPKVMMIAPNEDIYKKGTEVAEEEGFNAEIMVGNLSFGVQLAKAAEEEGYEAIISRGGIYESICKAVNWIPCVQISITTIDLLNAIQKASEYNVKIGAVGYANNIYGAAELGDYLSCKIIEMPIQSPRDLKSKLNLLKEKGIKVIIGDTISTNAARKMGIKAVPILSSKRSIYEAFVKANDLCNLRKKDAIEQQRLKTIINSFEEGILATDDERKITHFNPIIMDIFEVDKQYLYECNLDQLIPTLKEKEEILTINDKKYLVNVQNIKYEESHQAGHIIIFKELEMIQKTETRIRKNLHKRGLTAKKTIDDIISVSPKMSNVLKDIGRISKSNATVLINGETGVGKELIAQSIHNLSNRKNNPFVAVNCAAFSESLLESELFGFVEGSFTDAKKGGKEGLFELAHQGTIFLDEIGGMALSVQAKVLRVMQEREVMRLGDSRIIPVDIRILAATNENLWDAVNEKKFREDLYYRVNVLNLIIPSLSERQEDIPVLAKSYLKEKAPLLQYDSDSFEILKDYDWPGNVRQLFNYIEQLIVFSDNQYILKQDVINLLEKTMSQHKQNIKTGEVKIRHKITEEQIKKTLKANHGNRSKAAQELGIDRTTLWRRLKKMEG